MSSETPITDAALNGEGTTTELEVRLIGCSCELERRLTTALADLAKERNAHAVAQHDLSVMTDCHRIMHQSATSQAKQKDAAQAELSKTRDALWESSRELALVKEARDNAIVLKNKIHENYSRDLAKEKARADEANTYLAASLRTVTILQNEGVRQANGWYAAKADLHLSQERVRVLETALQAIADESQCHHEHNPISGKDRLPQGYTTIMNLACDTLSATSPQDVKKEGA